MYRFLIVIEKADSNYSAYCPDLPGCVATGKTQEETERNIYETLPYAPDPSDRALSSAHTHRVA